MYIEIDKSIKNGIIIDNFIWCVCDEIRAICKVDILTGEISIIKYLPNSLYYNPMWMFCYKTSIIMISRKGDKFIKYDVDDNNIKIVDNPFYKEGYWVSGSTLFEGNIYLLPLNTRDDFLIWDLAIDDICIFQENGISSELGDAITRVNCSNQHISIVIDNKKSFYYNLLDNTLQEYKYEDKAVNNLLVTDNCETFIFEDQIIIMDKVTKHLLKTLNNVASISSIIQIKQFIIYLPQFSESIIFYNLGNSEVFWVDLLESKSQQECLGASKMLFAQNRDNEMFFFPNALSTMLIVNDLTFSSRLFYLKADVEYFRNIYNVDDEKEIFYEWEKFTLQKYLRII